jgi:hypothetical protein
MTASARDFAKRPFVIVDLMLDRCNLDHGTAPCTATATAGSECYKTRATCQDPANYDPAPVALRLLPKGGPALVGISGLPCITSATTVPTEIDMARGIGPRGVLEIALDGTIDADWLIDPYHRRRTTAPAGDFWRRLRRRCPHYAGRWVRVYEGYREEDGRADLTAAATLRRDYILDAIQGPRPDGSITLTAKDPLKVLDRVQIPEASTGELSAGIDAAAVAFDVKTGQGAQYGPAPFHVRIENEIILVGTRTDDAMTNCTRAQAGTAAAAHDEDTTVQAVVTYEGEAIADVWQDLLERAGLPTGNIDTAGAAAQDPWIGAMSVTAYLSRPTKGSILAASLLRSSACLHWWDAEAQMVRLLAVRPATPADTITPLTDAANLVAGRTAVDPKDAERITRQSIYYAPLNWAETLDAPANFTRAVRALDATAEGQHGYAEVRAGAPIFACWFPTAEAASLNAAAVRLLRRYVAAPLEIAFDLEAKDGDDLAPGDFVSIDSVQIVDVTGAPEPIVALITAKIRRQAGDTVMTFKARQAVFGNYAFFTATGLPDYTEATAAQLLNARFCDAAGNLPDGAEGFRFG